MIKECSTLGWDFERTISHGEAEKIAPLIAGVATDLEAFPDQLRPLLGLVVRS